MEMIFPESFGTGDLVGLASPASPVAAGEEELCQKWLEALGFRVQMGETLRKRERVRGYLAGDARSRAEDLNRMFKDPKIKAIFCVRGGYGSAQLLEHLDYDAIRRNPKPLIGYSDITSIHCGIQKKCGLVTFHGPMVRPDLQAPETLWETEMNMEGLAFTVKSLFAACRGKERLFENPPGEPLLPVREGRAGGRLLGGNLSVLVRLLGTPYCPDFKDSILFLEDVGERLPRMDLCLTQLKLAGILEQVRGILLGDFTDCTNAGYEETVDSRTFLKEWEWPEGIPVISNICSDHRWPMATLPLGAGCEIEGTGNGNRGTGSFRFMGLL